MKINSKLTSLLVLVAALATAFRMDAEMVLHEFRGAYLSDGTMLPGQNAFTTGFSDGRESRSFYVFDLGAVRHGKITSAKFVAYLGKDAYLSSDSDEILIATDLRTSLNRILDPRYAKANYNALGRGKVYGVAYAVKDREEGYLEIEFGPVGLADLNARRGNLFTMGARLQSVSGAESQVIFNGDGSEKWTTALILRIDEPEYAALALPLINDYNPPSTGPGKPGAQVPEGGALGVTLLAALAFTGMAWTKRRR